MMIVTYCCDGMKSVADDDVTMRDFWMLFRALKKRCEADAPDQTYVYRTAGNSFELVDERLAAGSTQYVARPDNWPTPHGEPV